jgi:fructose-1,6-bisphosphatase I / sedoheptulose-1,7-bisphosphatase
MENITFELHDSLQKFLDNNLSNNKKLIQITSQIASGIIEISGLISKGNIANVLGSQNSTNVQGETQKKLDVIANEIFIKNLKSSECVAGFISEENENCEIFDQYLNAPFLVAFDPLDGSSNIDVNVSIGSIFSIYKNTQEVSNQNLNFLRPGSEQILAGYAIYGPATMLVITAGNGSHGFTLDRDSRVFLLTHPNLSIPHETGEYAINSSNNRFWESPIQRYVAECKAGKSGVRAKDFNMRWIASMVADVHRILMRGGVFMYPKDNKDPNKPGRLRLMYEANPMSFLIEQAGGFSSTGRKRIMQVIPDDIHQRIPVILGSRNEIERIENYYLEYTKGEDSPQSSPLFGNRSLFR